MLSRKKTIWFRDQKSVYRFSFTHNCDEVFESLGAWTTDGARGSTRKHALKLLHGKSLLRQRKNKFRGKYCHVNADLGNYRIGNEEKLRIVRRLGVESLLRVTWPKVPYSTLSALIYRNESSRPSVHLYASDRLLLHSYLLSFIRLTQRASQLGMKNRRRRRARIPWSGGRRPTPLALNFRDWNKARWALTMSPSWNNGKEVPAAARRSSAKYFLRCFPVFGFPPTPLNPSSSSSYFHPTTKKVVSFSTRKQRPPSICLLLYLQ